MKKNLSLYRFIVFVFIAVYICIGICAYLMSRFYFGDIVRRNVTSKLESDISYIYDYIGDGYWSIEEDGFYKGGTYLGDATEETAFLEPFLYIEEKTGTFSYVFQKCSDDGLTWTGDKKTGYQQGHFIRIAGSTRNPNGDSIVGTYMDKKVADIIDEYDEYIGEANVDGGMIYCIYRALLNEDYETVGCIVVGRNVSEINEIVSKYSLYITMLFLVSVLVGGFVVIRLFKHIIRNVDKIVAFLNEKPDCRLEINATMLQPIVDSVNRLHDAEIEIERQHKLSETDELTGIYNRLGLDDWLNENYSSIIDKGSIFLNLIDVDYFKEYNDSYGHPVGDKCLVEVADALKKACRIYGGTPFRLGGDEFVIMSANCDEKTAELLQECIYIYMQEKAILHEYSKVSRIVSLSQGGYVMKPDKYTSFHDIYVLADKVLYSVKQHGKNNYKLLSTCSPE